MLRVTNDPELHVDDESSGDESSKVCVTCN